jgi:hypothetical protein
LTDFFLTKLDVLTGWEKIPVCVAYEIDGVRVEELPASQTDFHHAKPIYENLPGWKEDISKARSISDLPKNAQQVVLNLDLEDDMRLSYGEALLQASRMEQQGGNLSTGGQKRLGRTAGLADKQAMMVDDEKIQTAARLAREKAEKVQAVISRGSSTVGETILHSPMAPAAEQAKEVVRKAPISKRTMEKMMSSNMLAAGVAAGGLGLLYASNKMRAEREVGR